MFKKIYKEIKKYNTIVIARHIGVDPDALASQLALKESIKLTFPNKNVYTVGNGSSKFSYMGKLDKLDNVLLDGFPRTLAQAQVLDDILNELNIKNNIVVYLSVDLDTVLKRVMGRIICPKCKKSYNCR